MKMRTLFFSILGSLTLVACGSKTDANEKNFANVISEYTEKEGELCINPGKWPVDVTEFDFRLQKKGRKDTKADEMEVLKSIGLVKGEEVKGDFNRKIVRYSLTEDAKPFLREWVVEKTALLN